MRMKVAMQIPRRRTSKAEVTVRARAQRPEQVSPRNRKEPTVTGKKLRGFRM